MKRLSNHSLSLLAFFLLAIMALFAAPATPHDLAALADATTIRVAPTGVNNASCGSTSEPCRTIQYAVNKASTGSTILVAAGTYTGGSTCLTGSTTAVVCALSKHLTILGGYSTSNWSTANPTANLTVIDGQNAHRGVQVYGSTATDASLRMSGFIVQNGRFQGKSSGGDGDTFAFGGGMLVDRAALTLTDVILRSNQAIGGSTGSSYGGAGSGGGLAIRAAQDVTLTNVTFENNQARGGSGNGRGGYAIGGGLYVYQTVIHGQNLTFTDNTAVAGSSSGSGSVNGERADAQGGAIAVQLGSTATLENVTATNNTATGGNASTNAGGAFGGAIKVEGASWIDNPTTFTLTNATLTHNVARAGDAANGGIAGGGGLESIHADVTLNRVIVTNNQSLGGDGSSSQGPAGGGGLYLQNIFDNTASATLENVIVADNVAAVGSGSIVGGGGGGIWLQGIKTAVTHATIANNSLGATYMQGSGLLVLNDGSIGVADVDLAYSIVADHSAQNAVHVKSGNRVDFNTVLFSGNAQDSGGDGTITGLSSTFSGVPDFVGNYRIGDSSAAINAASGSTTAVDVDGQNRTLFTPRDVGADEFAPLELYADGRDQTIYLQWNSDLNLLSGLDHYEIVIAPSGGAAAPNEGPSPINAGSQTTFTLTGLTNDADYTITVRARSGAGSIIATSNTVTIFPTDDIVFLPMIVK